MVYQEQSWLSPYLASQQNAGDKFVSDYIKPIETASLSVASTMKDSKIKEIIADETAKAKIKKGLTPVDAEGKATGPAAIGGLDYRSLERRLLPYDQELSAKYGKLADEQDKKLEEVLRMYILFLAAQKPNSELVIKEWDLLAWFRSVPAGKVLKWEDLFKLFYDEQNNKVSCKSLDHQVKANLREKPNIKYLSPLSNCPKFDKSPIEWLRNRLAPTTYTYPGGCKRRTVWLSYRTSDLVTVFVS